MNRREFVKVAFATSAMAGRFGVGGVNPVSAQDSKVVKPGLSGSDARRRGAVPDGIVRVVGLKLK